MPANIDPIQLGSSISGQQQITSKYDNSPVHPDENLITRSGRSLGDWLPNSILSRPGKWYTNSLYTSPISGALVGSGLSGIVGGSLGYLSGHRQRRRYGVGVTEDPILKAKRYAVLSALLGGIGSYGLGHLVKKSYFVSGATPSKEEILSKIHLDPSLNWGQKSILSNAVSQLSTSQAVDLKRALGTSFGASIGLLVSRYLMKMGIGGQVIATLAGGVIGNTLSGRRDEKDRFGNTINRSTDMYGRSRFI